MGKGSESIKTEEMQEREGGRRKGRWGGKWGKEGDGRLLNVNEECRRELWNRWEGGVKEEKLRAASEVTRVAVVQHRI